MEASIRGKASFHLRKTEILRTVVLRRTVVRRRCLRKEEEQLL